MSAWICWQDTATALCQSASGTTLTCKPTGPHQPSARARRGGREAWLSCPHPRAGTGLPSALALRFMSRLLPAATLDCLVSDSSGVLWRLLPHRQTPLVARKEEAGAGKGKRPRQTHTNLFYKPPITFTAGGTFPTAGKSTA